MTKTLEQIKRLFPKDEKRLIFLSECALTFQLSLDTLEEILGIDKNELYDKMIKNNIRFNMYLRMMFDHYSESQDVAKSKFYLFFKELCEAVIAKDKDKQTKVLSEIYDTEINEFRKKHKPGMIISENEMVALIKYQIKYSLTVTRMAELFGLRKETYMAKASEILPKYPDLKSKYDFLSAFFYNNYNKPTTGRKNG